MDQEVGTHREKRNVGPTPSCEANGTILAGATCDLPKEKWEWQDGMGSGLNFSTEDTLESYQSSHF